MSNRYIKFAISRAFHSWVGNKHGTDGETDEQADTVTYKEARQSLELKLNRSIRT